jgi:hypothetical protein
LKYSEAADANLESRPVFGWMDKSVLLFSVKFLEGKSNGRQLGVFQGLSQLVHGNMLVKEAKKKRRAHAIITL